VLLVPFDRLFANLRRNSARQAPARRRGTAPTRSSAALNQFGSPKSLSTVREHSGREYLQGMTADELFLLTFEDLEERVALGRGEYDALMSAWLLRKLLLDEQPLVHRANRSRRLKLKFRMCDDQPPAGIEGWGPGHFLWPDPENQSGRPIVELTLDQFLSRPTLVAFGHIITVRDLIKFMANYEGAVHTTVPNDEENEGPVGYAMGRNTCRAGGPVRRLHLRTDRDRTDRPRGLG
jgi:hypothetical protein